MCRGLINSLNTTPISFNVIDITGWGGADYQTHKRFALDRLLLSSRQNAALRFDIFAVNAENTPSLYHVNGTSRVNLNGYRIGIWHWETSLIPERHCKYAQFFHEIWTPSSYVADILQSSPCFPVNVTILVMPYAYDNFPVASRCSQSVAPDLISSEIMSIRIFLSNPGEILFASLEPDDIIKSINRSWVQRDSKTIFLSVFDFNSDFERKNIIELVRAYHIAFHSDNNKLAGVGFIIKSINAEYQMNDYSILTAAIKDVPFVLLIDGVFNDQYLQELRLMSSCFVSLHRSEGWGLNIIEELMLTKPVIVSAYGGSESYVKHAYDAAGVTELRIPFKLVNISRPFGPYTKNMLWAQPDRGAAVFAMRSFLLSQQYYLNRVAAVHRELARFLSPFSTGKKMKDRLDDLSTCVCTRLSSGLRASTKCFLYHLGSQTEACELTLLQ